VFEKFKLEILVSWIGNRMMKKHIYIMMIIAGAGLLGITEVQADPFETVLVEAESFDNYGAWVLDPQFMDQMGSPYLLAHGLGEPVADASTTVLFPTTGTYRVWVRTKDWVGTWRGDQWPAKKRATGIAPGRFEVLVNGVALKPATPFGTEGAYWHWQDGGTVVVDDHKMVVSLHDLTGFEGRCDAILFSTDTSMVPPDADPLMQAWRWKLLGISENPTDAGEFDLVVVGGGIAGTTAAVSAARSGLSVALIQDRPMLGGNNSSDVRVWLQGVRNRVPYPHIGDIVMELEQKYHKHNGPANSAEIYEDEKKIAVVQGEKNIELRLEHRANGVEMDGDRITAVIAENTRTGERYRFRGKLFADCTGDGCIGELAGADLEISKQQHMGRCNLWNVSDTGTPQSFPKSPWALDLTTEDFPGRGKDGASTAIKRLNATPEEAEKIVCNLCDPHPMALGEWTWESGFNHDPIVKSEYIRDWNFRAAYGAIDALKNVDGVLANHKLNWIAHISGKRESRRLLGDVILTKADLLSSRKFEDACFPACWSMDVHFPNSQYDKSFKGDAFIATTTFVGYKGSELGTYWVPYRCLYSRNISNMFMAGRDISVTRAALGAIRVMRTGGCMGEVVGLAASICIEQQTTPRGVWQKHLDQLKGKIRKPVYSRFTERPLPKEIEGKVGRNAALDATVTASSQAMPSYSTVFVNDRRGSEGGNGMRWVSGAEDTPWLEFELEEPVEITAMRITSGKTLGNPHGAHKDYWITGKQVYPIEDYRLEVEVNGKWTPIAGAGISANKLIQRVTLFTPTKGKKYRLLITKTSDRKARIWEVELFTQRQSDWQNNANETPGDKEN